MDVSQLRIILPCELEEKERKEKERKEKNREEKRKEITGEQVLSFLKIFREKIVQFNVFIQLYTPYPTISQNYKNTIRNRIRDLKSFYYDFNETNPYFIISQFESQDNPISKEICIVHDTVSNLLAKMNEHIRVISEKKVIFSHSSPVYDWT
jgi:Na+-transporting NADH:ubiquinone oxidoreductase subunit NqrC